MSTETVMCMGKRGWIDARATWAVYSPRSPKSPFAMHPVKRPERGHNGVDGGVVTKRMARSDARKITSQLRRLGVAARAFRVADGCDPRDVESGWQS